MSPEMDVDVGGTPEPESATQEMAADSESDAIVHQLEKGLPRWEGFLDVGWNPDISKVRMRGLKHLSVTFAESACTGELH